MDFVIQRRFTADIADRDSIVCTCCTLTYVARVELAKMYLLLIIGSRKIFYRTSFRVECNEHTQNGQVNLMKFQLSIVTI